MSGITIVGGSVNKKIVLTAALLVLGPFFAGGAAASPGHSYATTLLSGSSMLADGDTQPGGCAWDPVDDQLFPRQVGEDYESTVAVDPQDPARMVAVWLADDGLLVGTATSLDGGRNWSREPLPGATACSGGIHRTSFDTRVAIGTDLDGSSRAYAVATSQNQPFPDPRGGVSHIAVSTKPLDGSAWSEPVLIDASPSNDYPVIAADPNRPGTAYVMWSKRIDASMVSVTRDGGRTWSSPALVRTSKPGSLAFNEISVAEDGRLLNLFGEILLPSLFVPLTKTELYLSESSDGGITWSAPELVTADANLPGFNLVEGDGEVYAVWQRSRQDVLEVVVAKRQGGRWSAPEPVSSGVNASHPDVDVMRDGTVGIAFYETRRPVDHPDQTHVVVAHSEDGGASWETTDASEAFDREQIFWISDHGTIAATPCGFVTTWTGGSDIAEYGGSDIFWSNVAIATEPQGPCNGVPQGPQSVGAPPSG